MWDKFVIIVIIMIIVGKCGKRWEVMVNVCKNVENCYDY